MYKNWAKSKSKSMKSQTYSEVSSKDRVNSRPKPTFKQCPRSLRAKSLCIDLNSVRFSLCSFTFYREKPVYKDLTSVC